MSDSREAILIELMAKCADQVLAGASVAACLERYPEYATELKPLLNTMMDVHQLRAVPARSPVVAAQSRSQFLAAARDLHSPAEAAQSPLAQIGQWWHALRSWGADMLGSYKLPRLMPSGMAVMLIIVILSGILLTGIVSVSASALPGSLLYPVKTVTERVQVLLTFDPEARDTLLAELEERRIKDAKAIVELGRKVTSVPLQGTIDAITGATWQVSGLKVTITAASQIIGKPLVGSRIQGRAYAPGDGSLILRYAEVEPPPAQPTASPATPTPSPTPAQSAPSATATTVEPSDLEPSMVKGPHARPMPVSEPTDLPTPGPTATSTATATRMPTPTVSQTPTATATLTAMPTPAPPRDPLTGRIMGRVRRIAGALWTIDETTITTNAETRFIGNPTIGSKVEAIVEIKPNGSYLALTITQIEPPGGPPEPLEFTNIVQSINGSVWTIGGQRVTVTADTVLENNPAVGDLVEVKAERYADGEVRALRIAAIRGVIVHFDGIIEAMAGDTWKIGGRTVSITAETQISGNPAIGAFAQVAARQMPDGRLIAQIIAVIAATPTSTTAPATATPSATFTPEPTATPSATLTPEPTATPSATLTPGSAETPTLSATPEVTETSTPTPNPANPAVPTISWRPLPTDTATP